jgi:hypothetical protein
VFGIVKASIMNTGTSPIAIIFICISLIFIFDFLPHLCPRKNNSSIVAEPHVRFESYFDTGKLGIKVKFTSVSDGEFPVLCLKTGVLFPLTVLPPSLLSVSPPNRCY